MRPVAPRPTAAWEQQTRSVGAPPAITTSWAVRNLLKATFAASFLQYWTGTEVTQYIHIVLMTCCGITVLLGPHRRQRLSDLLRGGSLLLLALLFTEVISYYSGDHYSVLYGLALIGFVLSARLVLLQIGLPGVMQAFYEVGVLLTVFLAFAGRKSIRGYSAGNRFAGGGDAHPNLVAFILGGFLPVLIWRTLEYKSVRKRRMVGAVCILNFVLIFLTGSRGALLAVLIAAACLLLRLSLSGRLERALRIRHIHVMALLVLIPLVTFLLFRHARYERIGDFVDTALSLNSSQRGIGSGLSGRTSFWLRAIRLLHQEQRWLFGFGFRLGDVLVGTIDNGYVQLLFETGLISGLIIFGSLLLAFFRLWKATRLEANSVWLRYHLMLWTMLIGYMVNNISTRYLLSFGNCYSLCVIVIMVASKRELLGPAADLRPAAKQPPLGLQQIRPAVAGGYSGPNPR